MAAVKKTFDIALDIADAGANREFTVVDGDNGNVLAILLTDGGYPVDLTGCRVIAVFSKSDGTACQDSYDADGGITLCGTLNNQVDIELFAGSVAPGTVECELQIYSDPSLSTLVTTAKFNFACRKAIFSGETLTSAPQYPQLTSLMERGGAERGDCRCGGGGKLSRGGLQGSNGGKRHNMENTQILLNQKGGIAYGSIPWK